jgi:hypothetical protein
MNCSTKFPRFAREVKLESLSRPLLVAVALADALMKVGQSFHSSGFTANYVEVGGPDSGVLSSVGNTLATLPGSIISVVGSYSSTRFGSYAPM